MTPTRIDPMKAVEFATKTAMSVLQADKRHTFMALTFSDKGNGIVDLDDFMRTSEKLYREEHDLKGHDVKDQMAETLKGVLKATDAYGVIVISEVWYAEVKPEMTVPPDKLQMPRYMPNRIEGLNITWEFKTDAGAEFGMRLLPFTRSGTGKQETITFTDKVVEVRDGKMGGRLTNLLGNP